MLLTVLVEQTFCNLDVSHWLAPYERLSQQVLYAAPPSVKTTIDWVKFYYSDWSTTIAVHFFWDIGITFNVGHLAVSALDNMFLQNLSRVCCMFLNMWCLMRPSACLLIIKVLLCSCRVWEVTPALNYLLIRLAFTPSVHSCTCVRFVHTHQ